MATGLRGGIVQLVLIRVELRFEQMSFCETLVLNIIIIIIIIIIIVVVIIIIIVPMKDHLPRIIATAATAANC